MRRLELWIANRCTLQCDRFVCCSSQYKRDDELSQLQEKEPVFGTVSYPFQNSRFFAPSKKKD